MCAEQVHKKTGEIMREDLLREHTRSQRSPGSGPHRINQNLDVHRQDIYTRLFLSSIHAEYIFDYRKNQEDDKEMEDDIFLRYQH